MKLKPLALGLTLGILFAVGLLFLNYYPWITEKIFSGHSYGGSMRFVMEDIYPFYLHAPWYKALIGVVFAFVDGFVFGVLAGWLYNLFLGKKGRK